jgi:hypothetical protein
MQEQRRRRPIGVWLLTIWVGLNAGLSPIATLVILYLREPSRLGSFSPAYLALSVISSLAVLVSAVAAWLLPNQGRYAFVGLSISYYAMVAFNGFSIVTGDAVAEHRESLVWIRAIRAVVVAGVVAWYFLISLRAKEFYEPSASDSS